MNFAKLFRNLHHTKVLEIIDIVSHLQKRNTYNKMSSEWWCKIPVRKIRCTEFIQLGETCIYGNLPHPEIATISDHAYFSVKENFSDALAHNLSVALYNDKMKHWRVQIKFMHWSDDFEPNTGNEANSGNGVWVSTLTLLSPTDTKECVYNT